MAALWRSPPFAVKPRPIPRPIVRGSALAHAHRSLAAFAEAKLAELEARSERRAPVETARAAGGRARRGGAELISFCCNDYLGLSHHPAVKAAARRAIDEYGAGAGASRLVTGDHPLFARLEAKLAAFKGTEDCVVFGSGYLANLGILPVLAGARDLVVADELSHACLLAGAKLGGAAVFRFRHNDADRAEEILARERAGRRNALVVTDGVFSMDGDLAPIDALGAAAERHGAWLMTDDAHGVGVLAAGRGSGALARRKPPLQMGTLSKALGGYGGYLCADRPVVDLMRTRARTLIYSTGLPPASAAAALAALEIVESDPALAERPLALARRFARRLGLPEAQSPIVPVLCGESEAALAASRRLEAEGFLVAAIRPPTVPRGTARLRVTLSAAHREDDVDRLADAVRSAV